MNQLMVIPRSVFSFFLLFFITKLIGKKQVSELSLFDYVVGLSIGNFAAEMTLNFDYPFINGVIAVVTFGFIAYLVSVFTMKSILLRRFFIGTPIILIENGKIIEKNLRKEKMDVNDLLEQIRVMGYFDISKIEYGILEANGKMSVMLKKEEENVTNNNLNLKLEKNSLPANVIIDGKIMFKNLKKMNKDEKWLDHELKVKGKRKEDILLATLDDNKKLNVYEKNIETNTYILE